MGEKQRKAREVKWDYEVETKVRGRGGVCVGLVRRARKKYRPFFFSCH